MSRPSLVPIRRPLPPSRVIVRMRPPRWLVRYRTDVCLALVLAALVTVWWGR